MQMRKAIGVAVAAAALAGCGAQASHGIQDSPVSRQYIDNAPAQIINFPDGFANYAMKCDHHGNVLYSNTRDGDSAFAIPSKDCPDDWPHP